MKYGPKRYLSIALISLIIILILSACGPTTSAPYRDYYVSTTGTDASGRGTSSSRPWQTIQYAIDHADYSGTSRVRINVAAGTYTENLTIDNTRAGGTLGAVNIVGAGSGDPLSGSGLTVIIPATRPSDNKSPTHSISGGVRVELYDLTFQQSRLMATGGSLYMQNVWMVWTLGLYAVRLRDVGVFNIVDCKFNTLANIRADYAIEIVNSVGTIRGGYFGDDFDHVIDIMLSGSPTDGLLGDGYVYRSGASHVTIEGVTIHGSNTFYADGIRVSNRATAIIRDSSITRDPATAEPWIPDSSDGMAAGIDLLDPEGPGGSTVEISGNTISGFDVGIGLDIGGYRVKASGNDISALTDVVKTVFSDPEFEATPIVDFGGGPLDSPGGNTFQDVGMYAVNHQTPYEVFACFNNWQVADSQIENRIHDQLDDPSAGPVYWEGREGAPCGTASEMQVAETPTLGTPQLVEIFTLTPSITPTSGPLIVKLTKNAFCRKGPATVFGDVTGYEAGQELQVEGRNDDPNTWLLVRVPNGGTCWISYSLVEPIDLTLLPVVPTPIPPSPTPPPSNPQGCLYYDQQQNQACFPIDKCPVPFNQSLGACKP
jgi:hypothetical protein